MSIVCRLLKGALTETPIGDISATDLSDDMPSFPDKRDWSMVSKPSFQKRIVNAFRKSPWTFDLYFYNLPETDPEGIPGNPVGITTRFTGVDNIPEPKAGRITVIMFHHLYASDRLTPWMIAHRMAHAVDWIEWDDFVDMIWRCIGRHVESSSDVEKFFMMKTAREGTFLDENEVLHEVLAEFIITGDIRINPAYDRNGLKDDLIRALRSVLDSAVGKYWVAD